MNRRAYDRRNLSVKSRVRFLTPDERSVSQVEGQICDISRGGVGLMLPVGLRRGTAVHLRLFVSPGKTTDLIGVVANTRFLGCSQYSVGVKFCRMPEEWTARMKDPTLMDPLLMDPQR